MTEQIEEHILRRFDIVKKVGSGAYGHVWKVTDKKTGQILALKKIFDAFQHTTDAQRTYREIMFLKQFNHENIISLHSVFRAENDKDIYLVFEFMEADLHNVIRENILQDIHKQYIVYQIGLALRYLHSGQVIHRDLKPSNILLNSQCFVKLCDFGLVRSIAKVDDNCPVLTEYVATRWYRAPEILLGANDYSKSVDMWSLGCILAEIMIGKPIFPGSSTLHQLQKILSFTNRPSPQDIDSLKSDLAKSMIDTITQVKYRPPKQWFPYCSNQMIDLVVSLLQFNPSKRLTAEEVLKHPYVKQFSGKGLETTSDRVFRIENDEQKLTTKDYRAIIYETVKEDREAARGQARNQLRIGVTKDYTSKYPYKTMQSTGEVKTKPSVMSPTVVSPKNAMFVSPNYAQKKQKIDEIIKMTEKNIVKKKNTSGHLNEQPQRAKYPQSTKNIMSTIPPTIQQPYTTQYLSPKSKIQSPTISSVLKPNSPTYKYVYTTKDSMPQPYFSSIKKK